MAKGLGNFLPFKALDAVTVAPTTGPIMDLQGVYSEFAYSLDYNASSFTVLVLGSLDGTNFYQLGNTLNAGSNGAGMLAGAPLARYVKAYMSALSGVSLTLWVAVN
jgi:hypothetical protein